MAVTNNIREIREQRGIYQDDLAAAYRIQHQNGRQDRTWGQHPICRIYAADIKVLEYAGRRCIPCGRLSWVFYPAQSSAPCK